MELFDKVYSCYYQVVRHILLEAGKQPLARQEMEELIRRYGFEESVLTILPKLLDGGWELLAKTADGKSWIPAVSRVPVLPLTALQRSWLKALLSDPRFSLFLREEERERMEQYLADTEPLYQAEDFYYFDRYRDGDDYASPQYRENFQTILCALREGHPLFVAYKGKRGREDTITYEVLPKRLEYSSREDKFRLCCLQQVRGIFSREMVLNLGRVRACHLSKREVSGKKSAGGSLPGSLAAGKRAAEPVRIAISGERNSLERCMLHFASYEKHTEYEEESGRYLCSIYYDLADETELLVEILSFGPVIQVLGPESFLRQVRKRVKRQHELLYERTE